MASTMTTLGIDKLSVAERILLVEEIWDSIAAAPDEVPLTEAQRHDLQERLAEYDADPTAGASWDEVKARLRERS